MNTGILAALGAYILWGLFPLYLKFLDHVPPGEILGHRVVWSLVFVAILLLVRKQWDWVIQVKQSPRLILIAFASALVLGINWLTYILAATSGHIVEASLGYFISPLLNVLLGVVILGERLRPLQWLASGIALGGVLYIAVMVGEPPWIALILAFSFGFYGLIRKNSPLRSLEGLSLETLVSVVPALGYLLYLSQQNVTYFAQGQMSDDLLLAGTGITTALPLILFAYSAQRITLSLLGLLQYIGPTIQIVLGVWLFNEAFSGPKVIGFSLIWIALIVYSLEGFYRHQKNQQTL